MRATPEQLSTVLYRMQSDCPDIPVLAIQWMQMQYPVYDTQDDLLRGEVQQRSGLHAFGAGVRDLLSCLKHATSLALHVCWLRVSFRTRIEQLREVRYDVIAKSFSFGEKRDEDDRDFYLGDLQDQLERRGLKSLLICANGLPTPRGAFAEKHFDPGAHDRMPLYGLVSVEDAYRMIVLQLRSWFSLHRLARRAESTLDRDVCRASARDVIKVETMMKGLYYYAGLRVGRWWRPKSLITLYEGRSWERCLWEGVRQANRRTRIFGYQHAVLFPYMRSVLAPQHPGPTKTTPDVVLCLGEIPKQLMAPGHRLCGTRLVVTGSFGRSGASRTTSPRPELRRVLVVPVGWVAQTRTLFDFAGDLAAELPDHQFVLRCHPALPYEDVAPLLTRDIEGMANVVVSRDRSLAEDLESSSAALYRGSSVAFDAVMHGLKVLYYSVEDDYEEDPLYDMNGWRERVRSVGSAARHLQAYAQYAAEDVVESWEDAADYVDRYRVPVGPLALDTLEAEIRRSSYRTAV